MPPPELEISVVAPTYREAENIPLLATRIAGALRGREYEIIIADDFYDDATAKVCAEVAATIPQLQLITRTTNRGLSPAVLDGVAAARGKFVVVLDADLSHPPEKIPDLVAKLKSGESDFVVGSRYAPGGGTAEDWPLLRRLNSYVATMLARPLTPLADPMSGFFAFRRAEIPPADSLSPIGYKIGLEIAVKAGHARGRIAEAPIFFGDRRLGESKMTIREQWNYLRHLRRLYHYKWPKRMEALQFAAVGGIGFLWDALFYFGLQAAGAGHLWARALAFWPGVTSNWFLNRVMTFNARAHVSPPRQWAGFVAVSSAGFCINWGAYALLTSHVLFFMEHHFAAFIAGIFAGAAFNFIAADRLVFPPK